MVKPVSKEVKGRILALRAQNLSYSLILKALKAQNVSVSKGTASAVLKNHNNGGQNQSINIPLVKKRRRSRIWTPDKRRKLKVMLETTIRLVRRRWHSVWEPLSKK